MAKEYYLYVRGQEIKVSEDIYKVYWRGHSVDTKDVNLEILHFKQFYKHFVFEKDEEGYVKKTQKNYMDVRVVLRLV